MNKILLILLVVLIGITPVVFCQEEEEKAPLDEVAEVLEVEEKTEDEKNLDNLVEQYKAKQREMIDLQTKLRRLQDDILRMEGAIIIVQDMVKKQKKEE